MWSPGPQSRRIRGRGSPAVAREYLFPELSSDESLRCFFFSSRSTSSVVGYAHRAQRVHCEVSYGLIFEVLGELRPQEVSCGLIVLRLEALAVSSQAEN